jgi:hypothetical protein
MPDLRLRMCFVARRDVELYAGRVAGQVNDSVGAGKKVDPAFGSRNRRERWGGRCGRGFAGGTPNLRFERGHRLRPHRHEPRAIRLGGRPRSKFLSNRCVTGVLICASRSGLDVERSSGESALRSRVERICCANAPRPPAAETRRVRADSRAARRNATFVEKTPYGGPKRQRTKITLCCNRQHHYRRIAGL